MPTAPIATKSLASGRSSRSWSLSCPYLIVKREAAETALAALQTAYGWDTEEAHQDDQQDSQQQNRHDWE